MAVKWHAHVQSTVYSLYHPPGRQAIKREDLRVGCRRARFMMDGLIVLGSTIQLANAKHSASQLCS